MEIIIEKVLEGGFFAVVVAGMAFFIIKHLQSYVSEKAKNFASKQDIEVLTILAEKAKNLATLQDIEEISKLTELGKKDIEFKYSYYYEQFSKLYTKIYSSVCNSESVRYLYRVFKNDEIGDDEVGDEDIDFDLVPFLEEYVITNGVEQRKHKDKLYYYKDNLANFIIENAEYASKELLKLASCYLQTNDKYSGSEKGYDDDIVRKADEMELIFLREMVKCIIRDYNFLRRELRMDFDENELKTGLPSDFLYSIN